jgi:sugar phosphate isomerase/epimerase
MKLGVFTALFAGLTLDQVIEKVTAAGLEAVEIGTGAYPGASHIDVDALLGSKAKAKAYRQKLADAGLTISALSCHGNPIHPDPEIADAHHQAFERTVQLAARLGVGTVITFSGCPGGGPDAREPNWIVSAWPPEFPKMLEWQWRERVGPYWSRAAESLRSAGVKVAIEMHPNFVAYNPATMLRLRAIAPDVIGCNFDPSHMFWQGIDPVAAIRALGESIYHVHAKDCRIDARNTAVDGVLDAKPYTDERNRSWIFRTVGYGHGELVWNDIVSQLRIAGYDGVISIEHEDSVMAPEEGLAKAVAFLRRVLIHEKAGEAYWA